MHHLWHAPNLPSHLYVLPQGLPHAQPDGAAPQQQQMEQQQQQAEKLMQLPAEQGPGAALTADVLEIIFVALPTNCLILAVKPLNKHWHVWAVAKHRLIRVSISNGYIPLWAIQQCHRQKGGLSQYQVDCLCKAAAFRGDLDILQWLLPKGSSMWQEVLPEVAARQGNLEMLQWAKSNKFQLKADICSRAAQGGHLKVLQWARAHGVPWSEDTCIRAAGEGHLDLLKWARAHGCPWNWRYLGMAAAQYGHVHVLQWARGQGFHSDDDTEVIAQHFMQVQVLAWLKKARGAHGTSRKHCGMVRRFLYAVYNLRLPACP
jgi:hypothetical protein